MRKFLYAIFLLSCNNALLIGADRGSFFLYLDPVESWRTNYHGITLTTIGRTNSLASLPVAADDEIIVAATTTKAKEVMATYQHDAEELQPTAEEHKS